MKNFEITQQLVNLRLDKVVVKLSPDISRMSVQRLIDNQHIKVNNELQKSSYKVKLGDIIQIQQQQPKQVEIKAQKIPIEVVYQDNDIIVVNKPKGLVVHPANGNPDGTLVNAIMEICKESLSGIGGKLRPGIVHRIDKDTSGLLIIAKNDRSHIIMSDQFKNKQVKKTYIALVRGTIKENEATINMPISRSKIDRKKMCVSKEGRQAITHFKVLERYEKYTLIEINLETGRTHQIRVHMAYIGFPIIGDMVYSNGKNPFGVIGQMLHAQKIQFKHPITNKEIELEARLPQYFQDVLDEIKYSRG